MGKLPDHGHAEQKADHAQQKPQKREQRQRAVVLEQRENHHEHLHAVGEGVELAFRAFGAVAVIDGNLSDAPALVDRVDRQLRLDLESRREHRHRLREHLVVGAIPRHDVGELEPVDGLDEETDEIVAKTVESAVVFLAVGAVRQAISHHHVGLIVHKRRQKLGRGLGGIGVVAVDHDVIVGVDVAHHLAHNVALPLAALDADLRTVLARNVARAVGGVVVVDVNRGVGQDALEVVDHLRDGERFVVAGNDDGDGGLPRAIGGVVGSLKAHVGAPCKYVQSAAPQRATQNF